MTNRMCKCGGIIREQGKAYWDTLPSCSCANPTMASMGDTIISTTATMTNQKKQDWDEDSE